MRLYVVEWPKRGNEGPEAVNWAYAGTQAEAKLKAKEKREELDLGPRSSEVTSREIEIETAKPKLLEFLNWSNARPPAAAKPVIRRQAA